MAAKAATSTASRPKPTRGFARWPRDASMAWRRASVMQPSVRRCPRLMVHGGCRGAVPSSPPCAYPRCMATHAEAGWYDDGTGKQRWWDGSRWTEEYVDLNERWVELHTGTPPATAPARRGWYDDGRGRLRWWNGRHWTNDTRFSGTEESFSGIVVDGRWIHFGGLSEPIAGVVASYVSGAELLKRARLTKPAVARTLYGPLGLITPRL